MPKYADPAVYPVGTPAATDNVMTRTAAGADGNFALGNLAGMAPVAVANDQSLALIGGNWTAYALTAQARTLLAATTQAAQRTALALGDAAVQNIGTSGANVPLLNGGNTWSSVQTFNASGVASAIVRSNVAQTMTVERTGGTAGISQNSAIQYNIQYTNSTVSTLYFGLAADPSGTPRFAVGLSASLADTSQSFLIAGSALFQINSALTTTAQLSPAVNNVSSLGDSTRRWTQVFATNGTINTSDSRLKTEPRQLREAEFKAASAIARLPAVWRWLNRVNGDENCEPEGRQARKHFGPTVQAAIAVMESNGLDPFAYSFICYDEWEAEEATYDDDGNELTPAREAGDRYSFRKEELLCFIVRALAQEIDGLAERVAALEAKA